MTPCPLCGSQFARREHLLSESCADLTECDARRCAMQEPTPPPHVVEEHFRRIDGIRSASAMYKAVDGLPPACRMAVITFGLQHSRFQWFWSGFAERFALPQPWPERVQCPFRFPDDPSSPSRGEQCVDKSGHAEYFINMGHLPPAPEPVPASPTAMKTYRRKYLGLGSVALVAAAAMILGASDMPGAPRRPRLDPMPPPPEPPLPPRLPLAEAREVEKIRASSMYGRFGRDAMPRMFVRETSGTYEVPLTRDIAHEFIQHQKAVKDQDAISAAEAKRERKRRKRLGK